MVLTNGARARLEALTPPGHSIRIHLTITDDFPYAHAFVMIEAVAGSPARPEAVPKTQQ
jgi:holo-[acyl-carrier protein] synthase